MPHPKPTKRPRLSRRALERLTAQLAALHGWRHLHLLVADRLEGGYPYGFASEVLVRGDRAVLVFFAIQGQGPTTAQQLWISDLSAVRSIEPLVVGPEQADALARSLTSRERPTPGAVER